MHYRLFPVFIILASSFFFCNSQSASSQPLRLLTPNGGERIQAGREFLITWTGIDSLKPVRLEFSIDSGRTWQFITDTARGYSFLWKPIPLTVSDTCLIQISSAPADSTLPVNASMVRVSIAPPTSLTIINAGYTEVTSQTVSFSPDGTRIFVSSWSGAFDVNGRLGGWRQFNVQILDGISGAALYTLPAYTVSPLQTTRPILWWSSWAGYDWSRNKQTIWHPNSQSFLTPLTDSTLGIIDASNGAVLRTIAIPTRGNSTRIASVQWIGTGAEILVTAVHRFFHNTDMTGASDTLRSFMMRIDAASGMLTNTPFQLRQLDMANPSCGAWDNWGGGSISHNGERFVTYALNPLNCSLTSVTMHSTVDNSLLQMFPTATVGLEWWSSAWGGNSNIWSPDDALLAFCRLSTRSLTQMPNINIFNANTGQVVQFRAFTPPTIAFNWTWSPNSRKLLFDVIERGSLQRLVFDVQTGSISPRISPILSIRYGSRLGGGSLLGWGNLSNVAPVASSITWSPDSRYIAGFIPNTFNVSSNNTVGIWDAETGCLLQTFRLPFLQDSATFQRSFFQFPIQWSADATRLLLFSPWIYTNVSFRISNKIPSFIADFFFTRTVAYDGTALIIRPNIPNTACLRDVSDSLWSITPQSFLRANPAIFPPLVCDESTATITTTARNFGTRSITMFAPKLINNAAEEFTLLRSSSIDLATTDTFRLLPGRDDTLTVKFSWRGGLGLRQAFVQYLDSTGTTLATMTLLAQRDSLNLTAFNPPNFRVNLGRILQFRSTNATQTFTNTGTAPLLYSTRSGVQASSNLGSYPALSIGKTFRIDSLGADKVDPGDLGVYFLTFFGSENEGTVLDSIPIFRCGKVEYHIVVSANVIPFEPRIELDSTANFGRIVCSADTTVNVRIRNVGGRVMTVFSVVSTNRAFIPLGNTADFSLQPLESRLIPVRFFPRTGGTVEARLQVMSDDRRTPTAFVSLRGQKTLLQYAWQREQISFGEVPFGRGAVQQVFLTNQGTEPLLWNTLPLTLSSDYSIVSMSPNPLQAGSTATVITRFAGRRQATTVDEIFPVRLPDACQTRFSLNFTATILPPQARATIQDTVRLPRLFCETELSTTITLQNDGDADLRISSISYEAPISAAFLSDSLQLGATTIAPMARTTLRFSFQSTSTGTFRQSILLATNDRTRSTTGNVQVVILAQKDSVGIAAERGRVSFSTVEEMTALRDTILLRNTGSVPLLWSRLNPMQQIPFAIDSVFVVESIEPTITPPNSASRLIVRFVGNQAGFSAMRTFSLQAASPLAPECIRTTTFTLQAEVRKEPRLSLVQPASVRLLCENSTTLTVRLRSFGTEDVTLQTPALTGNTASLFRIVSSPAMLPSRTGTGNLVVAFQSAQTGTFTAQVRLRSNAANLPDTVITITVRKDSSGIQALLPTLEFSALPANTPAERIITIANTGTIPQGVVLPLRAGAFVLDSLGANPLPPNSQTQARVRFSGGTGGIVRDTLRLTDSCGRVLAIPVQARVVAAVATLPDTVSVQVGDVVEVPIFLRNRRGVEVGMDTRFRVSIANASLLEILSPASDTSVFRRVQNTVAQILTIRTPIASEQETEPLVRLRIRGLLGNATTTTITLDNVIVGSVHQEGTDSALYRTAGVNFVGGAPRLVQSLNVLTFAIAPNPIIDDLRVKLKLRAASEVVLSLVNTLGAKSPLFKENLSHGEQVLRVPLQGIASGMYWLECRVNTQGVGEEVFMQPTAIVR